MMITELYLYGSIRKLCNICYHFMKDSYCPDSIILWYVHTTPTVYIYIIRGALFLYQWGKEPLTTNTCQNMNTCLCQRHISPIKHRLVSVHIK